MNGNFDKSQFKNREWLGRDEWWNIQAACIFAQVEVDDCVTTSSFGTRYFNDADAERNFKLISTWYVGFNKLVVASPLWYVNKAIEMDAFEIHEALMSEVKRFIESRLPEDRVKLLNDYRYLALKLDLSSQGLPQNKNLIKYADEAAANHYKETGKLISRRKVAAIVRKRLEEDDKKFYAEDYVRNLLSGWNAKPAQ